jgi:hypothetical protein
MPDNGNWLMRPAIEGLCSYESLIDGKLDIADVQFMNDALTVKAINEMRVREWMEKNK